MIDAVVKTYYELLSVAKDAGADEIKHAFRREIARYHPDKVAHLGPEFLKIAEVRAAELTEAYRILTDPMARAQYDGQLLEGPVQAPGHAPPAGFSDAPPPEQQADTAAPAEAPQGSFAFKAERETRDEFVRRAALARLREVVQGAVGETDSSEPRGFDARFQAKPRRALFGRAEPPLHLLVRIVTMVDGAAVQEAWGLALKAAAGGDPASVLLMGSGLAPASELSATIAELRRKFRGSDAPIVVPVDVRDWTALVPTNAPAAVRMILEKLRKPA